MTWLLLGLLAGFVGGFAAAAVRDLLAARRRPHVHAGHTWDGFYEHCRCGACAGDLRDEHGHRHIAVADWPEAARTRPPVVGGDV